MQRCVHRCSLTVRKLAHTLDRQPPAIGGLGVERCHPPALPAKDSVELRERRAVLRRPGRRDLADAVRRAGNAGSSAGGAE